VFDAGEAFVLFWTDAGATARVAFVTAVHEVVPVHTFAAPVLIGSRKVTVSPAIIFIIDLIIWALTFTLISGLILITHVTLHFIPKLPVAHHAPNWALYTCRLTTSNRGYIIDAFRELVVSFLACVIAVVKIQDSVRSHLTVSWLIDTAILAGFVTTVS
jgi:hypothetical protein